MIIQATEDKIRGLRLPGMAQALRRQRESPSIQELSFEDRLAMLVDAEYVERDTRKLNRKRHPTASRDDRMHLVSYRHRLSTGAIRWLTGKRIGKCIWMPGVKAG